MTSDELLHRAQQLLQSIVDQAQLDDSRERTVELREWEVINMERWLQEYTKAKWENKSGSATTATSAARNID